MNKNIAIVSVVFALVLGYIFFEGKRLNDKFNAYKGVEKAGTVITKMPDISFPLFGAKGDYFFYKSDFNKRAMFLHFWATWCGPCEAEFPKLEKIILDIDPDKVHFVFVAVNDKELEIRKFLRKFPQLKATIVIDKDFLHQKYFGTYKLPETFLVKMDGSVIKKYTGAKDWTKELIYPVLSSNLPKTDI